MMTPRCIGDARSSLERDYSSHEAVLRTHSFRRRTVYPSWALINTTGQKRDAAESSAVKCEILMFCIVHMGQMANGERSQARWGEAMRGGDGEAE